MKMTEAERKERKSFRQKLRHEQSVNEHGIKKVHINTITRKILFSRHQKLLGYEIHHPFGWEDPGKFIYIPRSLNLQIKELLRKKGLLGSTNHWNVIRDLVNSCEVYTYIRC